MYPPEGLQKVRDELRERKTLRLAREYESAFLAGKRVRAFMHAEALAERGVPPCFRIVRQVWADTLTPTQRHDLVLHDLQWISAAYPEHKGKGGYAEMLSGKGHRWLRVAEYYLNLKSQSGEVWMIVRQLQLDEGKQWECLALRTMDVKRAAVGLRRRQETLKKALRAYRLKKSTGLKSLAPQPAHERRLRVWVCAQMTKDGPKDGRPSKVSPTRAARLYDMWMKVEGEQEDEKKLKPLTRQLANDDLQWMNLKIRESRPQRRQKKSDEDDE